MTDRELIRALRASRDRKRAADAAAASLEKEVTA